MLAGIPSELNTVLWSEPLGELSYFSCCSRVWSYQGSHGGVTLAGRPHCGHAYSCTKPQDPHCCVNTFLWLFCTLSSWTMDLKWMCGKNCMDNVTTAVKFLNMLLWMLFVFSTIKFVPSATEPQNLPWPTSESRSALGPTALRFEWRYCQWLWHFIFQSALSHSTQSHRFRSLFHLPRHKTAVRITPQNSLTPAHRKHHSKIWTGRLEIDCHASLHIFFQNLITCWSAVSCKKLWACATETMFKRHLGCCEVCLFNWLCEICPFDWLLWSLPVWLAVVRSAHLTGCWEACSFDCTVFVWCNGGEEYWLDSSPPVNDFLPLGVNYLTATSRKKNNGRIGCFRGYHITLLDRKA